MDIYFAGNKKVYADVAGFTIKTDQSPQSGGEGEYPEPFMIFLASLGACAGIYVKVFCDQRGIPTEHIKLTQDQQFNPVKKMIDTVRIQIHVPDDFPEKYEKAMIQTVGLCTVKKHLHEEISVDVRVERGS
ncbi:MAG: OsmC family protein [Bacteroidales bacterium]